ncbi:MAG: aminopeptidase P family protein [Pseudomonadota bacterium]
MNTTARLAALRKQLRLHGLSAYFVPNADPHQSEYPPACWNRRAWLSGFDGSAGEVVIGRDGAWLWTDGRYFLQAEAQLAGTGIELMRQGVPGVPSVAQHVGQITRRRGRVGVDPRVVSTAQAEALERALARAGAELVLLDENLVDAIWKDRPAAPRSGLKALAKRFAGEAVASKLKRVRAAMRARGAHAHVVTMLDAAAWLLNMRATDVDYNPVAVAYVVVTQEDATLFTEQARVPTSFRRHLGQHVGIAGYEDIGAALRRLGKRRRRVWVDPATASRWVVDQLNGADLLTRASPVTRMKAVKNSIELEGIRAAHVRDGVAMVRFLHWLERAVPSGGVTEMSAAARLAELRAQGERFQGLSFRTIAGYAAHGAIIHYSVDAASDIALKSRGLFLLDSGAQYLDGTTDITRTILLGERATRAQRDRYTRVLKGHIALATARFPAGTTGARLDTFARQFLWQAGLDYGHGTGHGVGAYLNVHEGPQSISPRSQDIPLEIGNVQSNEPGYYAPGEYGIRIENLIEVVRDDGVSNAAGETFRFDILTLCPIDTRLIDMRLVTTDEADWLNAYHRRVRTTLSPMLAAAERRWLKRACAPLKAS